MQEPDPNQCQWCGEPLTTGSPVYWLPHNDIWGHPHCLHHIYDSWATSHPDLTQHSEDAPYAVRCMAVPACNALAVAPVGPRFYCAQHQSSNNHRKVTMPELTRPPRQPRQPRQPIQFVFIIQPEANPSIIRAATSYAAWLANHPNMQDVFASDPASYRITVSQHSFTVYDLETSMGFTEIFTFTPQGFWYSSELKHPLSPAEAPWILSPSPAHTQNP